MHTTLYQIVGSLIAALVYSYFDLIAIWSGLSARHWTVRVLVPCLVLCPLLVLPARYVERQWLPILNAGSAVLVVFLGTSGWRVTRSWFTKRKIHLRDLFLVVLFIAILFGATKWIPDEAVDGPLYQELTPAVCFAFSALVSSWAVFGNRRPVVRLAVFVVLTPVVALPLLLTKSDAVCRFLEIGQFTGLFFSIVDDTWMFLAICIHGLMVAIYLRLWQWSDHVHSPSRSYWKGYAARLLFSLPIALPLAGIFFELTKTVEPPSPKMPIPNGYNLLAEGGRVINAWDLIYPQDGHEPTLDEQRQFMLANSQAFELAESAVGVRTCVPVDYFKLDGPTERDRRVRHMLAVLQKRAKYRADVGETDNSLHDAMNVVRLSQQAETGGVVMHRLMFMAWQRSGLELLRQLVPRLSLAQQRAILAELISLDATAEPLENFEARERILVNLSCDWPERLQLLVIFLGRGAPDISSVDKLFRGTMRLLICDLAIHAAFAKDPRSVRRLQEVPIELLPAIPQDPFDLQDIKFKRTPEGYILYCVGPNGRDDGGIDDKEAGDWPVWERKLSAGILP